MSSYSVHLTSSVRTNLLSLSKTTDQLNTTATRLASTLKINCAADDPGAYYAAKNLDHTADTLTSRLSDMEQSVETINAADDGIDSISSYLDQMKSLLDDALSTTDSTERRGYGDQFNTLIVQIRDMAEDSSYKGVNLLCDNTYSKVYLNESNTSSVNLQGINIEAATSSVDSNGELGSSGVVQNITATDASGNTYATTAEYALTVDFSGSSIVGLKSSGTSGDNWEIDWGSDDYQTLLNSVYSAVEDMQGSLKTQSTLLATDLETLSTREDFTNQNITIAQNGASELVSADLNEEGANELTLQTRQSLAVQCLSLASSHAQNALTLLQSA
jgi:flagellin